MSSPQNPSTLESGVQTLLIQRSVKIDAPQQIVYESILEELGPGGQMPDGKPFPMKIEPWPGGRWFRDLGNNTGHFWGHIQVIKPPALLEITGPMFMSYPAVNFIQYRLTAEGASTTLAITHRAMGLIPKEHSDNVHIGWEHGLKRIAEIARSRVSRG